MADDKARYDRMQADQEAWYESICKRCGKCCGAGEVDPCAKLVEVSPGVFGCSSYRNRLGPQRTVSGREFNCVEIREIIRTAPDHPDCAYRK
ncbi:MAG TPA: hypothetical protein P5287_04710 [bacterium]|nr:hypothetical protein [bacterium]